MKVAICICTYKRPAMLRRLLSSLPPEVRTIVVDNDSERSAESICLGFPVTYFCESRRGISHARNTALRLADADLIACIDDDEYPSRAWLTELIACQSQFDADIVVGAVLPDFDPSTPDWIKWGEFFRRPRYASGSPIPLPSTNNMLVHRRILAGIGEPFNPEFALTGAEDTEFFVRAEKRGAKIVFSNEAIVHEPIPLERCTPRYLRRRAFAGGNSYTRIAINHGGSRFVRGVKGFGRVIISAAQMPIAIHSKARFIRAQQNMWLGLGTLAALSGRRFLFYK